MRDAVSRGADALAMAGGDGSQAIVAAIAAEHSLPYACVPAGTRNHFALDLGVDRDDVVGALDALVDGGERVVDLADVNGRVFVNNVSLGIYGEAVQRPGYRNAKLRTLLDTIPDASPPGNRKSRSAGPTRAANSVRAGQRCWCRTTVTGSARSSVRERARTWTRGSSASSCSASCRTKCPPRNAVAAVARVGRPVLHRGGGRACPGGHRRRGGAVLDPPLRFSTRPGALKVRIARAHPGASPSAIEPDGVWSGLRALATIAVGRALRHAPRA